MQMRRPEVSSALAAVVDRATAKDLDQRYRDDAELIADLEDVLAIETARAGQAPARRPRVCARCPPRTRRRVPLRASRIPRRLLALAALLAVGDRRRAARRWRRQARSAAPGTPRRSRPARLHAVLARPAAAAHDYDPYGGDGEHPEPGRRRGRPRPELDLDDRELRRGASSPASPASGIYVDAKPRRRAQARSTIHTPTPGWQGASLRRRRRPAAASSTPAGRRSAVDADERRDARQARHRRQALPLLPGLDHEARRPDRRRSRSPRSTCYR